MEEEKIITLKSKQDPCVYFGTCTTANITSWMPTDWIIKLTTDSLHFFNDSLIIKKDGTIEFGPEYTPDMAAKMFWTAVSQHITNFGVK